MEYQAREYLSRAGIDQKAEKVLLYFDPQALTRQVSPIYEVMSGLNSRFDVQFVLDCNLGFSSSGKKVLGRFEFGSNRILIDGILPYDMPRFRWTLCHEIGHYVLHRKLDPKLLLHGDATFEDTATDLHRTKRTKRTELDWVEWQANCF